MAVCVTVEGSSGVVCYNTTILCARCRYGGLSCKHTTYVVGLLHSQATLTVIKHWVLSSAPTAKQSSFFSCKSTAVIPWKTTIAQQEIIKSEKDARFHIENGIAYLYPLNSSSCPICGAKTWSDPCMVQESFIVTEMVALPAKGIYICIITNK